MHTKIEDVKFIFAGLYSLNAIYLNLNLVVVVGANVLYEKKKNK